MAVILDPQHPFGAEIHHSRTAARTSPGSASVGDSEYHLINDGHGMAVTLTNSNRNDVTQLIPSPDVIPSARGRDRPLWRCPDVVFADRGYDQADQHSHAPTQRQGITRLSKARSQIEVNVLRPPLRPSPSAGQRTSIGQTSHHGLP